MLRATLERDGAVIREFEIEDNDYIIDTSTDPEADYLPTGKEHIISLAGTKSTNYVIVRIDDPANYSLCYGYRNGTTNYFMLTYDTATSTEQYLTDSGWATVPNSTTIKTVWYQADVDDKPAFHISKGYTG